MEPTDTADLHELIRQVRAEVAALAERVAKLEHGLTPTPPVVPVPAPGEQPSEVVEEPISEEALITISACVAAFLGERVHIRSIRVVSSSVWAQQGRVSIQASHSLH